jgi:intracellular multiplication protein IcmL
MAEEELQLVSLRDDFYRDGFYKALTIFGVLLFAIVLLVGTSLYLHYSKPNPMTFYTGNEFRTVQPTPLKEEYLSLPDLIQWSSVALSSIFNYDFINYQQQLKDDMHFFTLNGWKNFLSLLKVYADQKAIDDGKLFVTSTPAGAPFIINQGLLENGAYGWWVQMPINLDYSSVNKGNQLSLVLQILVVRVPTLNDFYGVRIDKIVVAKGGR